MSADSHTLSGVFGPRLVNAFGGAKATDDIKARVIAAYFGATWSAPCREFTKLLNKLYISVNSRTPGSLEVVYVSNDRDERSFLATMAEAPWLALPFEESDTKEQLSERFGVLDMPALVLLRQDGGVLSTDGVGLVNADPVGAGFPWSPEAATAASSSRAASHDAPPAPDIPDTGSFIDAKGKRVHDATVLNHEHVLYYFSAHWCGPCRNFTPVLAQWYRDNKLTGALDCEVVFVSGDNNEREFKEYHGSMPWPAVKFGSRMLKELFSRYSVQYFPRLVVTMRDGTVISEDAVRSVYSNPQGFPWPGTSTSWCSIL